MSKDVKAFITILLVSVISALIFKMCSGSSNKVAFGGAKNISEQPGPLRDKIAKEKALAQLDSIETASRGGRSEAEDYVASYKLSDHEDYDAEHYIQTCKLLDKYGGEAEYMSSDVNVEIKKNGLSLQKSIRALRIKIMPVLRKRWAKAAGNKLWENNINVNVYGRGNSTLEFVGGTFASNANIKATQEAVSDALHLLRFKRVNYKWYKDVDEYQYYTVDSKADSEL